MQTWTTVTWLPKDSQHLIYVKLKDQKYLIYVKNDSMKIPCSDLGR